MTHPKESLDARRIKLERIQRLKLLIAFADREREKTGHRGGPRASNIRSKCVLAWCKELARLEKTWRFDDMQGAA